MLNKICTRPSFATDFAKATSVKAMLRRAKTAKNAPYFAHSGCVPGLYPEEDFLLTAFIRSATPTNFIAGLSWLIASISRPEIG
jgi:hypothetical protein